MKKYLAKGIAVVVALGGLFAFSNVTQVQAKSSYRITKTKNYSSKTPFYNKAMPTCGTRLILRKY
nr:hypothetical protein [Lentilactobacillus otakiensis]